ncbi:MAG: tRNA lysidine(34) synthetase TilS [Bacteroidetes bacterium 4572_112]|nr:MAG: tRNA lysidine(34) synthetase TilS [Bacteroidetes bacterium 4572_112]
MFKEFNIFTEHVIPSHNKPNILLAVSGGMDSMAMLYLFKKSNYNFAVANVNFNLRGNESDGDSLFVKNYCTKNNIKFHQIFFDTNEFADEHKISTQMAARELRYEWFATLLKENNYSKIAVAHHLDDQVETFFINLLRGTGIAGMHGISINKDDIIRPLMFSTRSKIEDFIKKESIPYREDSSNASDKYQRNYIRHHILPEFKSLRSDFSESLNTSIQQLQEVEDFALFHINKAIDNIISNNKDRILIDLNKLFSNHSPKLILYYCLKDYGFQNTHINEIIDLINNKKVGASIQSSKYEIFIDRNNLSLRPKNTIIEKNEIIIESLEESDWQDTNINLSDNYNGNYKINDKALAFIDGDKLKFPLKIRNWQKGDSFQPLGMKTKKLLSDFFIDNKIPRIEKEQIKLLCSGENIIWIIGHRIDNRYSITKDTKRIIKLKYNGNY